MENLQRYTMVVRRDENGVATPALKRRKKGEVVKFSDIKDILNSTPDKTQPVISVHVVKQLICDWVGPCAMDEVSKLIEEHLKQQAGA